MVYTVKRLEKKTVFDLLQKCNNSFTPPLSHNIPYTIEEYAERLSANANFVIAEAENEIIGFLAYYQNIEGAFAYIPQVWVSDEHQRKGIGASMMEVMVGNTTPEIKSIRLEVRKNNEKAVSFYMKTGFVVFSDEGKKILLEKNIR